MKNLKRILELIKKTGDRFLFEDEKGDIFVFLKAEDYENMIMKNNPVKDLSEEELLNKINKDIAVWKANQEDEKLLEGWHDLNNSDDDQYEEDQYYFEPIEDED